MLRNPLRLAVAMVTASAAFAEKPLADAARSYAEKLPAGCIVTAEWAGAETSYSAAGKAEPDGIPVEKRVFEIGSISKVFTGLLLAGAVEEKKLRLDSTLKELLGKGLTFADPKVGEITLLELSTHTSGLPRLPGNMGPDPDSAKDPYGDYDRKKMESFLSQVKLEGEPPYPASYSNYGVGLLGELLADAYGISWDDLVKEKITAPLGMKDTMVVPGESQKKRLAPPHKGKEPGHSWTFQAFAGAGALRSTAEDLVIFGKALAAPEKTPIAGTIKGMLETRASYDEMGTEIGLGIIIGKLDGEREYIHSGGTGGYRSVLQVIPAKRSVRVVLINNDAIPAEAVLIASRENEKPVETPEMNLAASELDAFTGVYEMGPNARFTVLRRNEHLVVRLTGQAFLPVAAMGKDRFRYKDVAAELQFARDGEAVGSVTLFQNGRELLAKRSDEKPAALIFTTEEELKPYLGEYELAPGKIFKVTQAAGTLHAELTGQPAMPVFQSKPGYFEYDVVKAALEFQKDKDGKVSGLILHQNGSHPARKR